MSKSGGLYKNIEMSLKTANILVIAAILVLVFCFCFVVNKAETADAGENETTEAEYNL